MGSAAPLRAIARAACIAGVAIALGACMVIGGVDPDAYGPKDVGSDAATGTGGAMSVGASATSTAATTTSTGGSSGAMGAGGSADCQPGYTCLAAAPMGWTGPVVVHEGSSDTAPAPCDTNWPTEALTAGYGVIGGDSITCSMCTCTAPMSCQNAAVSIYSNDAFCSATPSTGDVSPMCNPFTVNAGAGAKVVPTTAPCQSGGGMPVQQPPSPSFMTTVRACATTFADACTGGGVCAPAIDGGICILQSGDVPCTSPDYPNHLVVYAGFADTRHCATCGCTSTYECTPQVTLYKDASCMTPIALVSTACVTLASSAQSELVAVWPKPTGGTCTPSGGGPAGGVVGQTPTTLCCK